MADGSADERRVDDAGCCGEEREEREKRESARADDDVVCGAPEDSVIIGSGHIAMGADRRERPMGMVVWKEVMSH
jgi:hypothetical protein